MPSGSIMKMKMRLILPLRINITTMKADSIKEKETIQKDQTHSQGLSN